METQVPREVQLAQLIARDNFVVLDAVNRLTLDTVQELMRPLVHVCELADGFFPVIAHFIEVEVLSASSHTTIFRGSSLASGMLSYFSALAGRHLVCAVLYESVGVVNSMPFALETDAIRADAGVNVQANTEVLRNLFLDVLTKLFSSVAHYPKSLRRIYKFLYNTALRRFSEDESKAVVQSLIFLRFICPAICDPVKSGMIEAISGPHVARGLVLLSKVVQSFANGTRFSHDENIIDDAMVLQKAPLDNFLSALLEDVEEDMTRPHMYVSEEDKAKQQRESVEVVASVLRKNLAGLGDQMRCGGPQKTQAEMLAGTQSETSQILFDRGHSPKKAFPRKSEEEVDENLSGASTDDTGSPSSRARFSDAHAEEVVVAVASEPCAEQTMTDDLDEDDEKDAMSSRFPKQRNSTPYRLGRTRSKDDLHTPGGGSAILSPRARTPLKRTRSSTSMTSLAPGRMMVTKQEVADEKSGRLRDEFLELKEVLAMFPDNTKRLTLKLIEEGVADSGAAKQSTEKTSARRKHQSSEGKKRRITLSRKGERESKKTESKSASKAAKSSASGSRGSSSSPSKLSSSSPSKSSTGSKKEGRPRLASKDKLSKQKHSNADIMESLMTDTIRLRAQLNEALAEVEGLKKENGRLRGIIEGNGLGALLDVDSDG